jgi:hypothetical protein
MSKWPIAFTTTNKVVKDFPHILQELADLKWAAVVIKNFYPIQYCKEVSRRITTSSNNLVTIKEYSNSTGDKVSLRYIGPGLGQYVSDPATYFRETKLAHPKFIKLYQDLPNPRKMVRNKIGELLPNKNITIAQEKNEQCSDAVVRIMVDGDMSALHRDSAMNYFKGWQISKYPTQFSALVCFQMPADGGELVVYKKRWNPKDDLAKEADTTGYPDSIVANTESCMIKPEEGDLYIFHPEIYHDIKPMKGMRDRITQGIFFATSKNDQKVVSWG